MKAGCLGRVCKFALCLFVGAPMHQIGSTGGAGKVQRQEEGRRGRALKVLRVRGCRRTNDG